MYILELEKTSYMEQSHELLIGMSNATIPLLMRKNNVFYIQWHSQITDDAQTPHAFLRSFHGGVVMLP